MNTPRQRTFYTSNGCSVTEDLKTLVYTHLVNFESDDYICKVAKTLEEASALIEAGFEYVTEMENIKLFRKPK